MITIKEYFCSRTEEELNKIISLFEITFCEKGYSFRDQMNAFIADLNKSNPKNGNIFCVFSEKEINHNDFIEKANDFEEKFSFSESLHDSNELLEEDIEDIFQINFYTLDIKTNLLKELSILPFDELIGLMISPDISLDTLIFVLFELFTFGSTKESIDAKYNKYKNAIELIEQGYLNPEVLSDDQYIELISDKDSFDKFFDNFNNKLEEALFKRSLTETLSDQYNKLSDKNGNLSEE